MKRSNEDPPIPPEKPVLPQDPAIRPEVVCTACGKRCQHGHTFARHFNSKKCRENQARAPRALLVAPQPRVSLSCNSSATQNPPADDLLAKFAQRCRAKIICRVAAANALADALFACVRTNSIKDWVRLLTFSFRASGLPPKARSGPDRSAASVDQGQNAKFRNLASDEWLGAGETSGRRARTATHVKYSEEPSKVNFRTATSRVQCESLHWTTLSQKPVRAHWDLYVRSIPERR